MKLLTIDDHSEVLDAVLFEGALAGFEEEGVFLESIKNLVYDTAVEVIVHGHGDEDIVHIDENHLGILKF